MNGEDRPFQRLWSTMLSTVGGPVHTWDSLFRDLALVTVPRNIVLTFSKSGPTKALRWWYGFILPKCKDVSFDWSIFETRWTTGDNRWRTWYGPRHGLSNLCLHHFEHYEADAPKLNHQIHIVENVSRYWMLLEQQNVHQDFALLVHTRYASCNFSTVSQVYCNAVSGSSAWGIPMISMGSVGIQHGVMGCLMYCTTIGSVMWHLNKG